MKIGDVYLAVDPTQNSDRAMDVRRIWLPRVRVRLVGINRLNFGHKRYVISYDGKHYHAGRLDPVRKPL